MSTADPTPPDVPAHELPPAIRLTDRFEHWVATRPDAPALTYDGTTLSWAQWAERTHRVSGALRANGIQRGGVVAFFDKNHPSCVELTLGSAGIGAATAVIPWRLIGDQLAYVFNDCRASLVFVGAELLAQFEAVRHRLEHVREVVVIGGDEDGYEPWLAAGEPVAPASGVDPDDACLVLYTSGTTGFPKGAMLTHRGQTSHAEMVGEVWVFGPDDLNLVAMPLFHVGGSSYIQVGIHQGVHSYMTREPDAASLFGALDAGATHAFLVPAVIAGVLQAGEAAIASFGRFKLIGYGASPMPVPHIEACLAHWPGTGLIQVYGMTELCGVVTMLSPADHRDVAHRERLASAGRPGTGIEMRIVDPVALEDVPTGESGEIWFRTAQLMSGYLGKPDETAETITDDGWIRTGDIGIVDDGGYVYVVDRVKDMIISGGENVYGPEVESVLAAHPSVAEAAIIGVPHEKWGETVKAVVAPLAGQSIDPDEVIAFTRERLAHFKCPTSVDVVEALPRNGAGKILKRDLRAPYWAS